jgi:hypothetical protein
MYCVICPGILPFALNCSAFVVVPFIVTLVRTSLDNSRVDSKFQSVVPFEKSPFTTRLVGGGHNIYIYYYYI